MKLHLSFSHKRFLTIIGMYTPMIMCTEQFYADLDTELGDMLATDKRVILGDFNTRVDRDKEQLRVIGKHGVGKTNSNGQDSVAEQMR